MTILETLGPFWVIGIALNVMLTGLAIWWVVGKMQPRKPEPGVHTAAAEPRERS